MSFAFIGPRQAGIKQKDYGYASFYFNQTKFKIMDLLTILLLAVSVVVFVVSIAIAIAIFKIRDNAERQSQYLKSQTLAISEMRNHSYLQLMKNINKVQVSKKTAESKGDSINVMEETKVLTINEWIKDYSWNEKYTVENVN